jgi:hypothetical protein
VAATTRVRTARSRNGVTRMQVLPVWTASDDTTVAGD